MNCRLMFIMAEQRDAIIVSNCEMKSFLEIHNPLHPGKMAAK